jgi:uncharacterized protein (DUF1810 family)
MSQVNSGTDDDPFDLARFVQAQQDSFELAAGELRRGRKESHWIWYIFPQLKGLGFSQMANVYGIGSLDEARAYLAHPVLGPRLVEVTGLVLGHRGRTLHEIFGSPDDIKFRSSMTLFARAAGPDSIFARALAEACGGEEDGRTLELLGA